MNILLTEEQFKTLVFEMSQSEIDKRSNDADLTPTEGQKAANNYRHGHIYVKGMKISIENPKGSKRIWKDKDGKEGYTTMKHHYGYFKGTSGNGKDGDAVDVFIGNNTENFSVVYVVDQKINGQFDESKVMLGFNNKEEAKQAYLSNYSKDWKGFMHITGVSIPTFKKWLYRGNKQQKPFYTYVAIKKKKLS
jgi:hypothetical protein